MEFDRNERLPSIQAQIIIQFSLFNANYIQFLFAHSNHRAIREVKALIGCLIFRNPEIKWEAAFICADSLNDSLPRTGDSDILLADFVTGMITECLSHNHFCGSLALSGLEGSNRLKQLE
jgi:hypothetical protein